jgi:hypothetical protein
MLLGLMTALCSDRLRRAGKVEYLNDDVRDATPLR